MDLITLTDLIRYEMFIEINKNFHNFLHKYDNFLDIVNKLAELDVRYRKELIKIFDIYNPNVENTNKIKLVFKVLNNISKILNEKNNLKNYKINIDLLKPISLEKYLESLTELITEKEKYLEDLNYDLNLLSDKHKIGILTNNIIEVEQILIYIRVLETSLKFIKN